MDQQDALFIYLFILQFSCPPYMFRKIESFVIRIWSSCTVLHSSVQSCECVQLDTFANVSIYIIGYDARYTQLQITTILITRQAMYVWSNIEAPSYSRCCSGKEISITYSECVCSRSYTACKAREPYCQVWPALLCNIFPHYLIKWQDFRKEKWLNTKCA